MRNCTHFRHPTDEQLANVDIFFSNFIICSLSTLNYSRRGRLVAPHTTKTKETRKQQYSPSVRLSSPHRNILQSTNQTIQAPQSKATSRILKLKIVYVYHKTSLGLREGGRVAYKTLGMGGRDCVTREGRFLKLL